jgi:hypothetical protein
MPGAYDSGYARAGPVLGTVQALAVPGTRARRGGGDGHGPRLERMLRWQKGTRTHASSAVAVLIMAQDVRGTPPDRTATTMRARHGSGFARLPSLCCHPLAPTTAPAPAELHARTGTRVPVRCVANGPGQGFPSIGPPVAIDPDSIQN